MRQLLTLSLFVALTGSAFGQHPGDLWLGQNSQGQIVNVGVDLASPFYLPPSAPLGPLGGGWALNNPGFDHVVVPTAGALPLAPAASLSFNVLSMTPGLRMISPNLSAVLTSAGQSGSLGGSDLHVHWHFHVHSPDHANYEDHAHYQCTLEIVDNSGTMTASEPITLYFQTEDVLVGDVDLDGSLTPSDLTAFYAVLADPSAATAAERVAADVNLDGQVDQQDLCPITVLLQLGDGFVRGDANEDLTVNIADAISMLGILFGGEASPTFETALDANSDTQFNIADPVFMLSYLFSAGSQPAAPFPTAGCP
ncbi:MAG: dockerin type I domain-containing protein [Planctomycetota bacterium]